MENTLVEFCPHCNTQTALSEVASYTRREASNPIEAECDPLNTEYHTTEYSLSICNKCESIFLISSDYIDIPGADTYAFQGRSLLYPFNQKILDGSRIPNRVFRIYTQACNTYRAGFYEPCVIMCRKTIEAICHELGSKKLTLKERLSSLAQQEKIDNKLLAWATELRLIGNDAAHDLDVVIEKIDAQDSLEFTEAILTYIYSLNQRFEEFKNRRSSKLKPDK